MPRCRTCDRRAWFWEVDRRGRVCTQCREAAAEKERAARREAFAAAGLPRRVLVGAAGGAVYGVLWYLMVALALFALAGGPGPRMPENGHPGWSIGAFLVVVLVGLLAWIWLGWAVGLGVLLGTGAAVGALVGAWQGARGRRIGDGWPAQPAAPQ